MRIGIDCRLWATTTGRYIRENIKNIAKIDSDNEYVLFMLSEDIPEFDPPENFKVVPVDIHWHTFKEQILFPFIALREKLDVLHVPYFNVPIFYPGKFITTIHDLTILKVDTGQASTRSPLLYRIKRLGFKIALLVAVKRSEKIITVSKYVKEDIVKIYKILPEKIKVIYNGVSGDFERKDAEKIESTIKKYNIKKPYLFYVGNAHPHKNVENLILAFEKVSEKYPDIMLVLGGKKYFFYEKIENNWKDKEIYKNINFAGFIDDKDLPAIYSGASVFVNPSLYEGFGLQLLEAFSCGTKVACSNTTSLPEVGGDAAFYFDPRDTDGMAETIVNALMDKSEERIKEGYERINSFSWEVSARKHIKVYTNKKGEQ